MQHKTQTFAKALKRYSQKPGIFEAISFGISAECGSRTAELGLPVSQSIEMIRLKRAYPEIEKLWALASTIVDRVFGKSDIFNDITEATNLDLQRSGAEMVPALLSGAYDKGLADATRGGVGKWKSPTFRQLLKGYIGPTTNVGTLTPQLIDADSYQFARYVVPVYPALAKSARIQDRIRLRLAIEQGTGEVTGVEPLSGHPMLTPTAVIAAKQWRFAPDSVKSGFLYVVLDYSLRCP
jgi:hypothetical protein